MVITDTGLGMIWAFAEIAETVKIAIKKRCNIIKESRNIYFFFDNRNFAYIASFLQFIFVKIKILI